MDDDNADRPHQEPVTSDGGGSSIFDDVAALIDDGRTMVEAELAFQKTRVAYAGVRGKNAALFGIAALALAILAVFALVFGTLLALTRFSALGARRLLLLPFCSWLRPCLAFLP